uniref:Uncharacterized protein n=1 Tax=Eptatretus burgeri TaxID=7764 RepID=A0A8C4NH95_EPTBU
MVKCLVVIRTKVSVHLRVINHCSGDVHIRVLRVGPRILRVGLGSLATIGSSPETPRVTRSRTPAGVYFPALHATEPALHATEPILSSKEHSAFWHGSLEQNVFKAGAAISTVYEVVTGIEEVNKALERIVLGMLCCVLFTYELGRSMACGCAEPAVQKRAQRVLNKLLLGMILITGVMVLMLFVLESEMEAPLLNDVRSSAVFIQVHHMVYCPSRRWIACQLRDMLKRDA